MLTQFNSHTLNTHIGQAYPPAVFGGPQKQGFVDVLAAHQTPTEASWYRGSADAVRRNLPVIFEDYRGSMLPDDMLIMSGQALYRMDYGALLRTHRENNADITIATHAVGRKQAFLRGITKVERDSGACAPPTCASAGILLLYFCCGLGFLSSACSTQSHVAISGARLKMSMKAA